MSTKEIEVIDLTGDTDPKGSVVGEEDSTIRQAESLPVLEEAPTSLTLIEPPQVGNNAYVPLVHSGRHCLTGWLQACLGRQTVFLDDILLQGL